MRIFRKIAIFITIITIIFTSGYALSTIAEYSFLRLPLLIVSLVSLLLLLFFEKKKIRASKSLLLLLALITIGLLSTFYNFSYVNLNSFFLYLFVVVLAFVFTIVIRRNTFLNGFVFVMSAISTIAIIGFVLTNVFGLDFNFPLVININGTIYQNAFVWFRIQYSYGYSSRIMGLFWEPGLFASYVTVAFLVDVIKRSKSAYNKIIFILSLVLSQSTAGYILLVFCLVVWAMNIRGARKYLYVAILSIAGVLVIVYFNDILESLIGTGLSIFTKLDLNEKTTSIRIDSLIQNIEIFKTSPVFGVGLGEANILFDSFTNGEGVQTSTSTYYLASFGIFGLLFTLILIVAGFKIGISCKSLIIAFVIPIIVLFIINKEPHSFFVVDYIFLFYLFERATYIHSSQSWGWRLKHA